MQFSSTKVPVKFYLNKLTISEVRIVGNDNEIQDVLTWLHVNKIDYLNDWKESDCHIVLLYNKDAEKLINYLSL